MKNSLTENDLKCGMIAYEVTELYINTVLFVSDVYISKSMSSKCIDYKSFYRDGDNIVLGYYIGHGFLNDRNIGASYNKNYWLVIMSQLKSISIVFMIKTRLINYSLKCSLKQKKTYSNW